MLLVELFMGGRMGEFFVSLFGNRAIDDLRLLEEQLAPIVKKLIEEKECVTFFVGRSGEFDVCAASLIKRVRRESGRDNSNLTLVLPYKVADVEYYEKYYDDVMIPSEMRGAHPKAAITLRNRWMVDRSDLVIVYAPKGGGGAFAAGVYAKKQNKKMKMRQRKNVL